MAQHGPPEATGLLFGDKEQRLDQHVQFGEAEFNQDFFLGQPLLNQEDTDFMDHFFANPNESSSNDTFFNGLLVGQKAGINGSNSTFSAFDSSVHSLADSQQPAPLNLSSAYAAQSSGVPQIADPRSGQRQVATQHFPGDTDVAAAASSLFDMAGQRVNENQSMWGSLPLHFPAQAMHVTGEQSQRSAHETPLHFASDPAPFQPIPHQSRPGSMDMDMWELHQQQRQAQRNHSHALHTRPESPHPPSQPLRFAQQMTQGQWQSAPASFPYEQSLKPSIQWGSDQNFGSNGFRGQLHPDVAKDGNLLGVPGANQAAAAHSFVQAPHPRHLFPDQSSSSGPLHRSQFTPIAGFGGLTSPFTPSAGRHGHQQSPTTAFTHRRSSDAARLADDPQARKRRRSRLEAEEEAEYEPPREEVSRVTASKAASSSKRSRKAVKAEATYSDDEDSDGRAVVVPARKQRKSNAVASKMMGSVPHTPQSPDRYISPAGFSSKKRVSDVTIRPNLTDDQKRCNHIKSEQRRRDLIKALYDDIARLIPSLRHGKMALSRSDVLTEAVKFVRSTAAGNAALQERFGIHFEKQSADEDGGADDAES